MAVQGRLLPIVLPKSGHPTSFKTFVSLRMGMFIIPKASLLSGSLHVAACLC